MLRDEALIFGRMAIGLTFTGTIAVRPNEMQVVCFPGLNQCVHEFIHHFSGVVWSGCDPQTFLAAGDGRIIDGLHVDVVIFHEVVGNFCALLWITNLSKHCENMFKRFQKLLEIKVNQDKVDNVFVIFFVYANLKF